MINVSVKSLPNNEILEKMKGAFGENLKHIKLRIVESGSKKRV